jgi:hypothetical protein
MSDEITREGWAPETDDPEVLARVVEEAFDYRGDVTVVTFDGREVEGYLFNRTRDGAEPFIQMFPQDGGATETIPYAKIRRIRFSGKDTANGNSYAAWLARKRAEKSRETPASGE